MSPIAHHRVALACKMFIARLFCFWVSAEILSSIFTSAGPLGRVLQASTGPRLRPGPLARPRTPGRVTKGTTIPTSLPASFAFLFLLFLLFILSLLVGPILAFARALFRCVMLVVTFFTPQTLATFYPLATISASQSVLR